MPMLVGGGYPGQYGMGSGEVEIPEPPPAKSPYASGVIVTYTVTANDQPVKVRSIVKAGS